MNKKFSLMTLTEREKKIIKGGYCGCGCVYANCGGSSSGVNASTNAGQGKISKDYMPINRS